jgi:hypothetical protein
MSQGGNKMQAKKKIFDKCLIIILFLLLILPITCGNYLVEKSDNIEREISKSESFDNKEEIYTRITGTLHGVKTNKRGFLWRDIELYGGGPFDYSMEIRSVLSPNFERISEVVVEIHASCFIGWIFPIQNGGQVYGIALGNIEWKPYNIN